jgi:hypothetical protein
MVDISDLTVGPYGTQQGTEVGGFEQPVSQTAFDLSDVPLGDPSDPADFAERASETPAQAESEVLFSSVSVSNGSVGDVVRLRYIDAATGGLLFEEVQELTLPDPDGEPGTIFGTVWAWVGKFPGELDTNGEYVVSAVAGPQELRETVTVTGIQPVPTGLDLFPPDEPIRVGETIGLGSSFSASVGSGSDIEADVVLESEDPDVARITDAGDIEGVSRGTATITGSVTNEAGSTSDTVRVQVVAGETDVDFPEQPGDRATFVIPLSVFNEAPFFAGFRDITLTIPQVEDISNAAQRVLPGVSDIRGVVRTEVNALDIPDPPTTAEIATAVSGEITLPDPPTLEAIGTEVLEVFDDAIEASERGFADVLEGAEDAAEAAEDTLTETVEPALDGIEPTVNSIETAVAGIPDDIATTGDLAFSSLENEVSALQTDIENLSFDPPEPDFPDVPGTEDITGAIEDELVPTIDGVSVLDDPVGFLAAGGEEALEQVLTAETQARLREVS